MRDRLLFLYMKQSVYKLLTARKEDSCHRSYQKCADERSDAHGSAHEKAGACKTYVHQNTDRSEGL